MAGDFNLPTLIGSYRSDFLDQIRANDAVLATMFDGSIAYSNQPTGAVKFASGVFQRWDSSIWNTETISIAGGGTGATTAAGARTALSVYSQAEIDTLANSFNTTKADKTITISANNGLSGGGSLAANRTISGVNATTSVKGVVQLNDTVTSTSTTQAATANAVRVANNAAIAAANKTWAMAQVNGATGATINKTTRITATSRVSAGSYQVDFTAVATSDFATFNVTPVGSGAFASVSVISTTSMFVFIVDDTGTAVDRAFYLTIFADTKA